MSKNVNWLLRIVLCFAATCYTFPTHIASSQPDFSQVEISVSAYQLIGKISHQGWSLMCHDMTTASAFVKEKLVGDLLLDFLAAHLSLVPLK